MGWTGGWKSGDSNQWHLPRGRRSPDAARRPESGEATGVFSRIPLRFILAASIVSASSMCHSGVPCVRREKRHRIRIPAGSLPGQGERPVCRSRSDDDSSPRRRMSPLRPGEYRPFAKAWSSENGVRSCSATRILGIRVTRIGGVSAVRSAPGLWSGFPSDSWLEATPVDVAACNRALRTARLSQPLCFPSSSMTETNNADSQDLVELIDRYNSCFYSRDIEALRAMYVDDGMVVLFDNHANCDTSDLADHLELVSKVFDSGALSELTREDVRVYRANDYACITLILRYSSKPRPGVRTTFVCERESQKWKIRHVHHSTDPNEE